MIDKSIAKIDSAIALLFHARRELRRSRPPTAADAPPVLSVAEAACLLNVAIDGGLAKTIAIGLFAGMRSSEVIQLRPHDIDLTNDKITLHYRASGCAPRAVPILPTLAAWLTDRKVCESRLACDNDQDRIRRLFRKAGLNRHGLSSLRSTFIVYHINAFNDPNATAAMIGRTDVALLIERYSIIVTPKSSAIEFWSLRPPDQ